MSQVRTASQSLDRPISTEHERARPWWKQAPLTRRDVGVLFLAYLALTAVYSAIGLLITHAWDGSSAGEQDADVNRWLERHRTSGRNRLAEYGAALSNTETKIALAVVTGVVMLWMYRRWRDWTWIVVALVLEVAVFGTSSEIVGRSRPPVEQLDGAPTNSWPSGHIAASTVFYVGLAIVIWRNRRTVLAKVAAVLIGVLGPTIVTTARLYQGMHYPTDAIGGLVLGATSLLVVDSLLQRRQACTESGDDPHRTDRDAPHA